MPCLGPRVLLLLSPVATVWGGGLAVETLSCDIVIAGGSAASLAAALTAAAASPRATVCLTDPTDWPGGQLTASAVSAIDGPILSVTGRTGHDLMGALGSPRNPGGCWVSTMCYEPAKLVRDYVTPAVARPPNLVVLNRTVVTKTEACSGSSKRVCALHAVQRIPRHPAAGEWSQLLSASVPAPPNFSCAPIGRVSEICTVLDAEHLLSTILLSTDRLCIGNLYCFDR